MARFDHPRALSFRITEDVWQRILKWRETSTTEKDVGMATSLRRLIEQGLKGKERKAK